MAVARKASASTRVPVDSGRRPHANQTPRTPLELDRVIHERLRLGIVSALAVADRLSFQHLKQLLETTDGNLSVHARKLEDADYITSHKSTDHGVSKTEYKLTPTGRRALDRYLAHMEAIIGAVKR
jgi:DNA-binding MarR family transcriptional regulator